MAGLNLMLLVLFSGVGYEGAVLAESALDFEGLVDRMPRKDEEWTILPEPFLGVLLILV
jgi:hypothetical protein